MGLPPAHLFSASVIEQHESGAHALIGDECGRLTCLTWDFDREQNSPGSSHRGSVAVRKVDMGVVSDLQSWSARR